MANQLERSPRILMIVGFAALAASGIFLRLHQDFLAGAGLGAGFVVPLWTSEIADEIERVSTDEAAAMSLRLARDEGLFGGTSTGGNVVAALRLAERLEPGSTIVTIVCDTGMKYLSKMT